MIFRPSEAHRWMTCALSQVTPPPRPEPEIDAAREGTCAAWVAETVINGDATSAEDMLGETHENGWVVDADMVRHVQDYIEVVERPGAGQNGVAEVFMTSRGGLQGTADHVQWHTSMDMLWITDLKYGYNIVEPENNWQLLCYLALVLRGHAPELCPELVNLAIYQPRAIHPDGPYRRWVVSKSEYIPLIDQIHGRIDDIRNGETTASPGKHCKHCALAAGCEALTRSVYAMTDFLKQSRTYANPAPQQLADELVLMGELGTLYKARHSALESEALARLNEGQMVPGWCVEQRYGKKKFTTSDMMIEMITGINPVEKKTCTPAELIRRGADPAVVKGITTTPFIGTKLGQIDSDQIAARFAAAQKGVIHE